MLEGFDPKSIQDLESVRQCIVMLRNLVEELKTANEELRAEVAQLRAEIARLKGASGKPKIQPNTEDKRGGDQSSEKERQQPADWHKRSKVEQVRMDRAQSTQRGGVWFSGDVRRVGAWGEPAPVTTARDGPERGRISSPSRGLSSREGEGIKPGGVVATAIGVPPFIERIP